MSSKRKNVIIASAALILIVFMIVYLVVVTFMKNSDKKQSVGIVLSGSINENGWNGMHYEGIKKACKKAGVELIVKENVKEFTGKCQQAVSELAEENADMIILSSYNYPAEIADVVSEYPDIAFYANSSENHYENMTSYFVRLYQARYLSGVLAGMKTETNKIGYVAAMPNNEVNRGISAFTLGARSVNPEAEVIVIWSDTWDDSKKEAECTEKLINECNVDLVTYHQNGTAVIDTAEKYGVSSIGYHQHYNNYSSNYLTSVVCNWDKVYSELIKKLLSGEANKVENMWIGIKEEAIGLSDFSEQVTEEEKQAVEKAKQQLISGKEIFSGLIYDIDGQMKCDDGETISDEELLENFDWYAMGVKFYE